MRRLITVALGVALVGLAAAAAAFATSATTKAGGPINAAAPTISGTAREGEDLVATSGSWSGTGSLTYAYEWQRCDKNGTACNKIPSETDKTYTVKSADVGNTLRVKVVATDSNGTGQAFSDATGVVAAKGNAPANTKSPTISGNLIEGQTLTGNVGTWDGTAPITFSQTWQRCNADGNGCTYPGVNTTTYVLGAADVGKRLRFQVTAKNGVGSGGADSALTDAVVAKGAPPASVDAPVILGSAQVGNTLTGTTGTWSGATGAFKYQWRRCNTSGGGCSDIGGATNATYTVQSADAGLSLRIRVTASNTGGSTSAASAPAFVGSTGGGGGGEIQLPGGGVSVPVNSLVARPDHLILNQIKFDPPQGVRPGQTIKLSVRVDLEGTSKVVRGALVYVVGIPFNFVHEMPEIPTGTDGWATFNVQTTSAATGTIVFQVRARGTGNSQTDILGGISTRRLISVAVAR